MFMQSRFLMVVPALLLAVSIGCGGSNAAKSDAPAEMSDIERAALAMEQQAAAREGRATANQQAAEVAAENARLNEAPKVVDSDDMKRGASLKGGGALSTIMRTRFVAEHRMNLIQVEHAINLFWGAEGRYPKSHEEFMTRIIEENGLTLPELDGEYEYVYNPEDHLLYKRPLEGQVEAEVDPQAQAVQEEVRRMIFATGSGDAESVLQLTHPKLIELGGGKDEMAAAIRRVSEKWQSINLSVDSLEFPEPPTFVTGTNRKYVIVPMNTVMSSGVTKLESRGFVVGAQELGSSRWFYFDGEKMLSTPELRAEFADFPEDINLPEVGQREL